MGECLQNDVVDIYQRAKSDKHLSVRNAILVYGSYFSLM